METKLPSSYSPSSFYQERIDSIQQAGRRARSVRPAAVLTGFARKRREAKCRTAVSSPPLQPLKQNHNSITGKKTLGDLTGSARLSPRRRNYDIHSSLAGRVSQEIL